MDIKLFVQACTKQERKELRLILDTLIGNPKYPEIRILVKQWSMYLTMSVRLYHILNYNYTYLDEITYTNLMKQRNCGPNTVEEFKILIENFKEINKI